MCTVWFSSTAYLPSASWNLPAYSSFASSVLLSLSFSSQLEELELDLEVLFFVSDCTGARSRFEWVGLGAGCGCAWE